MAEEDPELTHRLDVSDAERERLKRQYRCEALDVWLMFMHRPRLPAA